MGVSHEVAAMLSSMKAGLGLGMCFQESSLRRLSLWGPQFFIMWTSIESGLSFHVIWQLASPECIIQEKQERRQNVFYGPSLKDSTSSYMQ